MGVDYTVFLCGGPPRPDVSAFTALLRRLWEGGLVEPEATLIVGSIDGIGAIRSDEDRTVRWGGDALEPLLAVVAEVYEVVDVAVVFPAVSLAAFAPAEPDEDDEGTSVEGEIPPELTLCSVRSPVRAQVSSAYTGSTRSLGRASAWARLDGDDLLVLYDYVEESRLYAELKRALGRLKVGADEW